MSGNHEFSVFFDDERRKHLLHGVFESYYRATTGKVAFDTNRSWTGKMPLVAQLFPAARVICCVREIPWIIDSLERLLNKHPLQLSRILNFAPSTSIYARIDMLMNSENGLIGQAWATLREAWFGEHARRLIVISYESLTRNPGKVIGRLYEELQEPPFNHDFEHVDYEEPEFDRQLGTPGLHTVRGRVEYAERRTCLPPDIAIKHSDLNFWTRPELNLKGVTML